jgi:endoglucanase
VTALALLAIALLVGPPTAGAQQLGLPLCDLPGLPICEPEPGPGPPPLPPAPEPTEPGDCNFARTPVNGDKRAVSASAPNPLAGEKWYVDTYRKRSGNKQYREPAYRDYLRAKGRDKALLGKVALTPRFTWFGRFTPMPARICAFVQTAEADASVPLVTVLRHQGRKCNADYQAGGVAEDDRSKAWYDRLARGIGTSRAIIAFEPDSVGTIDCLAKSRRKARLNLLRYGVDVLSKLPNVTIYIEASASDWRPAKEVAQRLRYIGIAKVRGFMLNVTHFDWTAANVRYGMEVSRMVGGKHFIVSTNHSGRGPVHYRKRIGDRNRRVVINCQPLRRGLGPNPTTKTATSRVDAYMWISRPGYSRGACNGGPPKEGDWWLDRALELARYATPWTGPPRGTRYGFPSGKLSLGQAAGDQLQR